MSQTIVYPMSPQPVVKRLSMNDGWDISGVPCFMGTPEYHLWNDRRFQPPLGLYDESRTVVHKFVRKTLDVYEWVIILED